MRNTCTDSDNLNIFFVFRIELIINYISVEPPLGLAQVGTQTNTKLIYQVRVRDLQIRRLALSDPRDSAS